MMKVLIPESIAIAGVNLLKKNKNFEIDFKPGLSFSDVLQVISKYDGIITRSGTPINMELLKAAKKLRIVGRAGVGIDNIDMDAASKRGILVINVPAGNIVAATEHTIAMMLSSTRQIPNANNSLKDGKWDRKLYMGTELFKKTLGIIGFGKIGSRVAKRLKAFEMNVIAYDPYIKVERAEQFGVELVNLNRLLKEADFITVHTPLTDETRGMIGKNEISKMKKNVRLVNCARGGIYDEDALYDALKSKRIQSAAIDVFQKEPANDNRLRELDNVVLTPHLGANTEEAQDNVSIEIAEDFIEFERTGFLANALNAPFSDIELAKRLGPYMHLAERIGILTESLLKTAVKEIIIEVQGIESESVKPLSVSTIKGFLTPIMEESVNYVNALFEASERGIVVKWLYTAKCIDYQSLLKITVISSTDELTISGTCFGHEYPRIVAINDYLLELQPNGHLILVKNKDIPGVIGEIGTLLGKHKINIAEYRLGRSEKSKLALAAIVLDEKPKESVLNLLRKVNGIISVNYTKL